MGPVLGCRAMGHVYIYLKEKCDNKNIFAWIFSEWTVEGVLIILNCYYYYFFFSSKM